MPKHKKRIPGFIKLRGRYSADDPIVKRSCVRKHSYPTRKRAAHRAAQQTKESGRPIGYYHCRMCGQYHLTSKATCAGCGHVLQMKPTSRYNVSCKACGEVNSL